MQTEDLLIKRRTVLEKKMEQELQKAKEYTKAKNKRGAAVAHGAVDHCLLSTLLHKTWTFCHLLLLP